MPISQLLRRGRRRRVGRADRLLVNNRLVARTEVALVDDRLGVSMTEINESAP